MIPRPTIRNRNPPPTRRLIMLTAQTMGQHHRAWRLGQCIHFTAVFEVEYMPLALWAMQQRGTALDIYARDAAIDPWLNAAMDRGLILRNLIHARPDQLVYVDPAKAPVGWPHGQGRIVQLTNGGAMVQQLADGHRFGWDYGELIDANTGDRLMAPDCPVPDFRPDRSGLKALKSVLFAADPILN